MASSDVDIAHTVPCPACKRPADSPCVDLSSNAEVDGVHQTRIYRAYVVAAAIAENRVAELEAKVERMRKAIRAALDCHNEGPYDVCCGQATPCETVWHLASVLKTQEVTP